VKGEQDGSYANLSELPADEYTVLSRLPSGSIENLVAPNRVMVVSTVPMAANSTATFDAGGYLVNAILARDATIFGVPLLGGSAVELNAEQSTVIMGTLGIDTTIDGVPYSKGCVAHLPPTDADRQTPPSRGSREA
jgi:hypothetical protein